MKNNSKKKIKCIYYFAGIVTTIILITILSFTFNNSGKSDGETEFPQNYRVLVPYIPEEIEFCGEEVPLYNFSVFERIEREFIVNTYYHSATILSIKRANRWFPVIEKILEENGVPNDFKFIALAESGLANVVSPKKAVGFWQILKEPAKKYGLEITDEIDERYNVEKSTEAACKYLLDSYEKYGSWTLAAASYNLGKNGITNQLERQKADNYYNLVLNEETSRYVPRAIAYKEIFKNPKLYGFDISDSELYKPFNTYEVKVNSPVKHWADFAEIYKINYTTLKLFNPWLRENYLTNKKNNTYYIKIPIQNTIEIIPARD